MVFQIWSNIVFTETPNAQSLDVIGQEVLEINLADIAEEVFSFLWRHFCQHWINVFVFIVPVARDEKLKDSEHFIYFLGPSLHGLHLLLKRWTCKRKICQQWKRPDRQSFCQLLAQLILKLRLDEPSIGDILLVPQCVKLVKFQHNIFIVFKRDWVLDRCPAVINLQLVSTNACIRCRTKKTIGNNINRDDIEDVVLLWLVHKLNEAETTQDSQTSGCWHGVRPSWEWLLQSWCDDWGPPDHAFYVS